MANIAITGVIGKSGRYFLEYLLKDTAFCKENQFTFIIHSAQRSATLEAFH